MKDRDLFFRRRLPGTLLVGLFMLFGLFAMSACGGGNGNSSSHVYDNAHVLDTSSVQSAAANLSYPLDVYTTSTFTGNQSDFQRTTFGKLHGDANRMVMAIDTSHRYMYIARGTNVPLSSSGIGSTVGAFSSHFGNGDYTGATLAAIDSIQQTLGNSSGAGSNSNAFAGVLPTLLCIGLLLIIGAVAFTMLRRRRFGGVRPMQPDPLYQQPPAYPYNQGNYYGQPMNQGGMNPWVAGGLGAAGGGLLGYELGKEAGERQADEGNMGDGGAFGDGGGGNFGGGGDFGGGNAGGGDFGGGGSFGGGDAGGFGGGGDFGGGGGFGGDNSGGGGNF